MKKIIGLLLVFIATQNVMAQKEDQYLLAWCSSKEIREVKLGCLSEAPMVVSMENGEMKLMAYKIAFINANNERLVLSFDNNRIHAELAEKAKAFRPVRIEMYDVIISDKESTLLLEKKFSYPFSF
jgi:hypothetical protein